MGPGVQRFTIALLIAIVSLSVAAGQEGPAVTTKYGKVQGFNVESATIFYGIPYASPPVGPLRWEKPQEPKKWDGVYNATTIKPACAQYDCDHLSPPLVCPKQTSEDCLYLDIYTPKGSLPNATSRWPVMVFIHGGNFVHMSGSSPLFDGRRLAGTRGVIHVNMNYRLGALGFLVTGETEKDARGNYGILDQQQAMKWVMDNIQSFGGDTSRITLYGQSAGAQSTLIHLTVPSSAPYFHHAIIESTPIAIPYKRFPEAILLGGLFAGLAGCQPRDMDCLRSKTANELAMAQLKARSQVSSLKLLEFFEPWGPFVDGDLIKAEPLAVLQSGQFSRKPIIIGSTAEETVLYVYSAWNSSVSNLVYGEVVAGTYPAHVLQIMYMYPPSYPSDERDEMVKMSTDLVFACPTRNATRILKSLGLTDVWVYVWDHAFSFPGWGHVYFCEGRVCHGSELVYLFHSEWASNYTFTADEEILSQQIMDFWTNFAKTGDPNNPGPSQETAAASDVMGWPRRSAPKLKWPVYAKEGDWPNFRFQTPESSVDTNYHGPYCDFWDTIGYSA